MKFVRRYLYILAFHLRKEWMSFLFWSIFISLYKIFTVKLYKNYSQNPSITQVYESLPDFWKNFLGKETLYVNEFSGWVGAQFFAFLPLILGVYLCVLATSFITKEIEGRSIELPLVVGVSRIGVLCAKFTCILILIAVLLSISFLSGSIAINGVPRADLSCFISFYLASLGLLFFFSAVFLLISVVVRNQKQSLSLGMGILFFLFIAKSLLRGLTIPTFFRDLNPFYYFDPSLLSKGILIPLSGWLLWIGGGAFAAAIAAFIFNKKDFL